MSTKPSFSSIHTRYVASASFDGKSLHWVAHTNILGSKFTTSNDRRLVALRFLSTFSATKSGLELEDPFLTHTSGFVADMNEKPAKLLSSLLKQAFSSEKVDVDEEDYQNVGHTDDWSKLRLALPHPSDVTANVRELVVEFSEATEEQSDYCIDLSTIPHPDQNVPPPEFNDSTIGTKTPMSAMNQQDVPVPKWRVNAGSTSSWNTERTPVASGGYPKQYGWGRKNV